MSQDLSGGFTRLPVSLEQYEVGLSGAVPERDEWSEPAMDRGILEFVSNFSGMVFKYGGRIVHGSHPTFTPIILRQARLQAGERSRKPVTLVRSELFPKNLSGEDFRLMTDVAELIITRKIGDGGPEDPATRNQSLTAMRRVLIHCQNVMVAVGGKMHTADGKVAGVGEEMTLAGERAMPRFVIAGLGGFAREFAKGLSPGSLGNALSDEDNMKLASSKDVAACVSFLFRHMAQSELLLESTFQPIRWDPLHLAIVDYRAGVVDSELTKYIVDASS